ncbi:MAG TPA: DUF2339 domain-containing protein [Chitinophagaceae bacterium]|nr:DUF2339 domain-containing protein [Chitinophagaceae bacterium]HPH32203.1 DUF2339 domain-containing protein [Chitinophagaceae bacterium]
MDGIIVLIILFPVVFLFLLISLLSRSSEQKRLLHDLYDKLNELNGEIKKLRQQQHQEGFSPAPRPVIPPLPVYKKEEEKPLPQVSVPEPVPAPVPVEKPVPEPAPTPVLPKAGSPGIPELLKPKATTTENKPSYQPEFIPEKEERDYEKFIGENIANKIGIAVLVLGIAFFIKYAIDKDWVHEGGRVIIGLICGAILVGLAHYFRNQYRSFSSVLVGGGLSVFYFSIAFAFHQYHLIGQSTAFILMVLISGSGVFLALFYNRQELAILATIGGFITPFLVSTGQDNYNALFTYLAILNTGLMVLAWFKRWPSINTIALVFTTIIYGGWLTRRLYFSEEPLPRTDALLFASIFFGLFIAMHIINTIRLKNKFTSFDFTLLLSTSFLYYVAGMLILDSGPGDNYKGLFTALLGLFYLGLSAVFYKQKTTDRNFVFLLIGLTVSFLSLVAPVQYNGNHITLFWAAETVVLFWLYQRSQIQLLKTGSLLICLLMTASLVSNWSANYIFSGKLQPVILNEGYITSIVVAVSYFLFYWLNKKESSEWFYKGVPAKSVRTAALSAGIITAYLAGIFEIGYQFNTRNPGIPASTIYWQCYTFIVVLVLLELFKKDKALPLLRLSLTLLSFGLYFIGMTSTKSYALHLITQNSGIYFTAHWAAALLLFWLLYQLIRFFFKKENEKWNDYRTVFSWLTASGIVLLLSVEMYLVIFWIDYRDASGWAWSENLYYKAGLSILWGLSSFAMMWMGMKKDFKTLRIISLTLFTVTIGKLFLYDIVNIPPGGKIAAFILLGILLLAVSFMYQRLKKILLDNNRSD